MLKDQFKNIRYRYDQSMQRHGLLKPKRLAMAYDLKMMDHRNMRDGGHPERPERVEHIVKTHEEYGLLPSQREREAIHVQSNKATKEDICLVHDAEHWNRMADLHELEQEDLDMYADTLESVYLNNHSFDCALLSAGNVIQVLIF